MNPSAADAEDRFPWEDGGAAEAQPETQTEDAEGEAAAAAADAHAHAEPAGPVEPDGDETDEDGGLEAAAARVSRDRPIAQKEYYSISEVCDLVGLKPHVLRYWETQFQVLNPSKNRSGNRVYQRKEIRLVLLVKHLLYEEKYTVEGAKQKIEQLRRGGKLRDATTVALDDQLLALVRDDLRQLLDILKPTGAED
jgi:DNA-binding transcriptional MerR regulator